MIEVTLGYNDDKPKLFIPTDKYKQIMAYIKIAEGEISWLFDVDWDKEEQIFKMGQIYLLEQEVTAASTDMDEEAISKFLYEQIKAGKTQMPRGWGHSHAHMGTFFSGTDRHAISDELDNNTFFVSIVCNKSKEIKGNIRIATPYGIKISLDDIEVEIEDHEEIPEEWKKEVATKVKTRNSYWDKEKEDDNPAKGQFIFGSKDGKGKKFLAKKLKNRKIQFLPKDAQKAAKIIADLKLVAIWDEALKETVWFRESNKTIYRDLYGSVPANVGTSLEQDYRERYSD